MSITVLIPLNTNNTDEVHQRNIYQHIQLIFQMLIVCYGHDNVPVHLLFWLIITSQSWYSPLPINHPWKPMLHEFPRSVSGSTSGLDGHHYNSTGSMEMKWLDSVCYTMQYIYLSSQLLFPIRKNNYFNNYYHRPPQSCWLTLVLSSDHQIVLSKAPSTWRIICGIEFIPC